MLDKAVLIVGQLTCTPACVQALGWLEQSYLQGACRSCSLGPQDPPPLVAPTHCPTVVSHAVFGAGVVGAKAYNLAKLRSTLPDWVRVPASVALPFGVFEAVMDDAANAGAAAQLRRLQAELGSARVSLQAVTCPCVSYGQLGSGSSCVGKNSNTAAAQREAHDHI